MIYLINKNIVILGIIFFFFFYSCTPVTKKNYRGVKENNGKNYKSRSSNNNSKVKNSNRRSFTVGALDPYIEEYWGTRYKFGGSTRNGFDCSGFMCKIFDEAYSIKLPRNSKTQYKTGSNVSKSNLRYGDLVFFNTSGYGVSHVGVYIGNGKFAHASSSKGVTISRLDNVYYKSRYLGARRILR